MSNPFEILREAVKRREPCWNPTGEKIPIAFRFMELCGEAGETANAGKKLARKELGLVGGNDDLTNLKEELGDVIICCELIAQHYDIDLWEAVKDKFNKTSDKHKFPVRIG